MEENDKRKGRQRKNTILPSSFFSKQAKFSVGDNTKRVLSHIKRISRVPNPKNFFFLHLFFTSIKSKAKPQRKDNQPFLPCLSSQTRTDSLEIASWMM
jgi:hypothetical protein